MQQRWFSPTIRNRSLKISHFGIWRSGARVLLMVSATLALVAEAHADCPGPWPQPDWTAATPAQMGLDESKLEQARDYALGAGGGSGIIVRSGRSVMNWGSQSTRYDLKSTTKSIGITALGLAVGDGLVAIDDAAQPHYSDFGIPPASNAVTGWLDDITLRHLATHSAGFPEDGGFYSLAAGPGLEFRYTNGGANWLADVLTVKFGQDLWPLLADRIFVPLGITMNDLRWRDNWYRPSPLEGVARRELGSGIRADVDAMARIGHLYLRGGCWDDQQLLPEAFIDEVRVADPSLASVSLYDPVNYPDANNHYGLLWWNNADGTLPGVPLDAYWSWGLYESFIIVIPSLDLVIARAGAGWTPGGTWNADYSVLAPFIDPIVEAACGSGGCTPVPALGRVWTPTLVGILLACCVQRLRQAGRA